MNEGLNTAVSGLLASQRQLAVTSNNIANANVDGYSRQRVELSTQLPYIKNGQSFGQGVLQGDTQRFYDQFVVEQQREVTTEKGRLAVLSDEASYIDSVLSDKESGISSSLQSFFNAANAVSNDPNSSAARIVLLDESKALTERFASAQSKLDTQAQNVNRQTVSTVAEINSLTESLHEVNKDIRNAVGGVKSAPPALLDERDKLLSQLSEKMPVSVISSDTGEFSVFAGQGQLLVSADRVSTMHAVADPADPSSMRIQLNDDAQIVDITDRIDGGKLGGLIEFRKETLEPTKAALGQIAYAMTETVNAQHQQGMGLDGSTNQAFFSIAGPEVKVDQGNTGTAAVSARITDINATQPTSYELKYDGAQWSVQREDGQGGAVTGGGLPLTIDGVEVTLDSGTANAGDSFLIQPFNQASSSMKLLIKDPDMVAAAKPVRTEAGKQNTGNGEISLSAISDPANANMQTGVRIEFTSDTTFDVVNASSGAALPGGSGLTYTPDAPISFNGWEATISGKPANGDTFTVSSNQGGKTDNRNMLEFAGLQTKSTMNGGTASYQESLSEMTARVGSATRSAKVNLETQTALGNSLDARRESVSGVNLDEEAANLIRFQQAYQAAAQAISTSNKMFETLVNSL